MRTYRILPVKLTGGYYERCNPGDPEAVWTVYSHLDGETWLTWIADTPSREMALALTDALAREETESGSRAL